MQNINLLKVAMCQIAPVWLDKTATLQKMIDHVEAAAAEGTELLIFGEGLFLAKYLFN